MNLGYPATRPAPAGPTRRESAARRAARRLARGPATVASPAACWAVNVAALLGAALMVWSAVIHLQLWADGYRSIAVTGPLFLIQGVGSIVLAVAVALALALALAVAVAVTRRAFLLAAGAVMMAATAVGAVMMAATAVGLLLSAGVGLAHRAGCAGQVSGRGRGGPGRAVSRVVSAGGRGIGGGGGPVRASSDVICSIRSRSSGVSGGTERRRRLVMAEGCHRSPLTFAFGWFG